jgi:glycosyltransferase involved in cell wall biosynthesis
MHILQVLNHLIPATDYGGTERVVWWLSRALTELGHRITILAPPGSACPFAQVIAYRSGQDMAALIPADVDVVHIHDHRLSPPGIPTLFTFHGNRFRAGSLHENTVFISADQARRHGGKVYVHNGLDLAEYGQPDWKAPREDLIFLAKAAWKVKNVRDAIYIARQAGRPIVIAGGTRLNFKMGFRFTLDRNARFLGMVDHARKVHVLKRGLALLFPVRWHEPFGLALIEALYFGNPVLGTPFGALPEIVTPEVGFLSRSRTALIEQVRGLQNYNRRRCHAYVCDNFNSRAMAENYLGLYEQVCNGHPLHSARPAWPDSAEPALLELED